MQTFRRTLCNNTIRKFINQNEAISQSTVFQGTLYEYTVMRELETKLCMRNLKRVGGANDHGIDIKGHWNVDQISTRMAPILNIEKTEEIPKRFRVNGTVFKPYICKTPVQDLNILVQCKAHSRSKIGPKEFRELVGAFSSTVTPANRNKTVTMMCSPHILTRDSLKFLNIVAMPIIYLQIGMLHSQEGLYDLVNSGKLLNYFENQYAQKFLQGCGVNEWLKLAIYDSKTYD